MNASKKVKIIVGYCAVAAVAVLVAFALLTPDPSDQELIKRALEDSIQASKEGRSGSVIELLSRNFTVNEQRVGSFRDVARIIRDQKPDVEIANWQPTVQGDKAEIVTLVTVKLGFPLRQDVRLAEVRLQFEREPATKWLFVPSKAWKLKNVDVPDSTLGDLSSQFGGLRFGTE
jgi:hypothetical protein